MGNSISGLLAMVYMTRLENQIVDNLQIGLYKRFVDDVLILTTTREEADRIFNIMNSINENIKFEAEYPTTSNSISMLDFCLTITDGEPQFRFYKKEAKRNMFPHFDSAMPMSIKRNIINNEVRRISERCTLVSDKITESEKFLEDLTARGYKKNTHPYKVKKPKRKNIDMTNFCYFQFPFVNDTTHHAIRRIFTSAQLPVRIFNKNNNLRSLLSRQKIQENCSMKNCSLNDGKLCHTKMCVYEMQCENCNESYIGSTTRALHNRIREHLQSENSSVFKHRRKCAFNFCVKVIARDKNANRLRFKEAIFIQEKCPKINNKVERDELLHLIF
jgi:predicted GIY-YIG superfamily endonuclease